MQVHVGLWMEHHCWWNYYPLASKRAELHIFAGLINNVGASSTLIGSLSTLKPIHSSALVDSTLAPWRLEVQNTGWCRRYQSVGVNLDCEVSPTGWTFFSLQGETRNSPSLELNILCAWCFSIKVLIIWLTSTRSRDRAREIDGLLYWKLWTLPPW